MRSVLFALIVACFPAMMFAAEPSLNEAYLNDDKKPLITFLESWHQASKPITNKQLQQKPKFEQELYRMYAAFFRTAEFYQDVPYILIQGEVEVSICDGELDRDALVDYSLGSNEQIRDSIVSEFTVKQFRPEVKAGQKKVLYYDRDEVNELWYFLAPGAALGDWSKISETPSSGKYVHKRIKWLKSHFHVISAHWGFGFHFATHPQAECVYLSRDLKNAVIAYREYYGGGGVQLSVEDGEWIVLSRKNSWIE